MAGFHPDLSGRENVFVNGIIGGLTRSEVRQRFDAIVEFAELSAFIDNPLRTYSIAMARSWRAARLKPSFAPTKPKATG